MSKTALIDGDLLFYSVASAAEYGLDPEDVNLDEVYHSMEVRAANVMVGAGCDKRRIFLTGDNFRYFISSDYKAHRKAAWKPSCLPLVRQYAVLFMGAEMVKGLEADDLLAINQTEDTVICTIDKDLQQVNGWHYRWAYRDKEPELFEVTEGWRLFYTQLLMGDSTDNILGCAKRVESVYKTGAKAGQKYVRRKGIGEKKAKALIDGCSTPDEALDVVYRAYLEVYNKDKVKAISNMTTQARLIRMITETKGSKAKLWTMTGLGDAWIDLDTGVIS